MRHLVEREIFIDNLLVRVHLIFKMGRPALRHGQTLHLPANRKPQTLNVRCHTRLLQAADWIYASVSEAFASVTPKSSMEHRARTPKYCARH